jgi:hypothetical protein
VSHPHAVSLRIPLLPHNVCNKPVQRLHLNQCSRRWSRLACPETHARARGGSGEIAHGMLSRRSTPLVERLGDTCMHFTWGSRGAVSLEVSCALSGVVCVRWLRLGPYTMRRCV